MQKKETVLITGGTGLIGEHLCQRLIQKGYDVTILSRSGDMKGIRSYSWDIEKNKIEPGALSGADYIIHLAGTNIGQKKWTKSRRELILSSRLRPAELLFVNLKKENHRVKAFISASAIGIYGSLTSDKVFKETDPAHADFLGNVCLKWEESADQFEQLGIRVAKIRTGIVLSKKGGVLGRLAPLFRLGFGSAIGSGRQFMPWIHIEDLCNIYIQAIENKSYSGAFNAVAPQHCTNLEFSETIARVLNKKIWLPKVPAFALRFAFGKMADIILYGSRVSSGKLEQLGFNFIYKDLESALTDLVK